MSVNGLTKEEQREAVARIHGGGMTVKGWARTRGFSIHTVQNVLYRQWGRGAVGPVATLIIEKLLEEGLV